MNRSIGPKWKCVTFVANSYIFWCPVCHKAIFSLNIFQQFFSLFCGRNSNFIQIGLAWNFFSIFTIGDVEKIVLLSCQTNFISFRPFSHKENSEHEKIFPRYGGKIVKLFVYDRIVNWMWMYLCFRRIAIDRKWFETPYSAKTRSRNCVGIHPDMATTVNFCHRKLFNRLTIRQ